MRNPKKPPSGPYQQIFQRLLKHYGFVLLNAIGFLTVMAASAIAQGGGGGGGGGSGGGGGGFSTSGGSSSGSAPGLIVQIFFMGSLVLAFLFVLYTIGLA